MNHADDKVQNNATPLLGNNNNLKIKTMISDTGSDCPYNKMNDESADNFEAN